MYIELYFDMYIKPFNEYIFNMNSKNQLINKAKLEAEIKQMLGSKKVKSVFINEANKLVSVKLQKYERKMPIFLSSVDITNLKEIGLELFFINLSVNEITLKIIGEA